MWAHSSFSEVQGIHNNVCLQMAGGRWLLPMDRRDEVRRGRKGQNNDPKSYHSKWKFPIRAYNWN